MIFMVAATLKYFYNSRLDPILDNLARACRPEDSRKSTVGWGPWGSKYRESQYFSKILFGIFTSNLLVEIYSYQDCRKSTGIICTFPSPSAPLQHCYWRPLSASITKCCQYNKYPLCQRSAAATVPHFSSIKREHRAYAAGACFCSHSALALSTVN